MPGTHHWCFGPFRLDPATGSLWRDAVLLPLPPKPFAVLAYLVAHAGQVVTKETLLAAVWPDTAVTEGVLKTCLAQIRQVLGETARTPQYIATLSRRGYRFVAPVMEHTEAGPGSTATLPLPTPDLLQHHEVEAPLPALAPPAAERRHLTVLFCDLVGSTALAGRLDPEEYSDVVRAYHQTCTAVVQRFDGYVAQYLGDGVLVYFGYPVAHDDDALRAVRAGLDLVDTLAERPPHPALPPGEPLAVRLGVHTGLVVVSEGGAGPRSEPLALGETPTIAARLQELAAPNTVVCSAATARLVDGYLTLEALGPQGLKGVATPVAVYRVVGESGARMRFDVAMARGLTPLVGREVEAALLRDRWAAATDGRGQVVLLSGEAGIGKSRLVQAVTARLTSEGATRIACHCSPYAQQRAFYPVVDYLHRRLQGRPDATPEEKLGTLDALLRSDDGALAARLPLVAALLELPLPARYPPLALSPQRQKQQTLDTLCAWLLQEAARQPVCMIIDDLHWSDPSTLEWLSLLMAQIPMARVLLLLLFRPEFHPPWVIQAHCTHLALGRLSTIQTAALVWQVVGATELPGAVVQQVVATTDGVPLFVEELTKMVLESGLLQERDGRYELTGPLPPLAIPATLADSLMARLDRLGPAKQIAQLGAVVGREFAYEVLQAVAPVDEATLHQGLAQLVEAELLYQRGVPPQARYTFKHVLIQEAAYQALLTRTRQQSHQRIAQVLEAHFPATVETQPELLAQHYTAAGLAEQAIPHWQRAGERATARSATGEAISHLTTALELLMALPDSPQRRQQELTLHLALGPAFTATKGQAAPEVEHVYTQARELCRHVGELPQLFQVLLGLWGWYEAQGQLHTALELGEQLLTLAHRLSDAALRLEAHHALGATRFWRGEVAAAHAHFAQGIALYEPQHHRALAWLYGEDPGVVCRAYAARALWFLGYPAQAVQWSHDALTLAREVAHPFSYTYAVTTAAALEQFRRAWPATQAQAAVATRLATEQGLPYWGAWSTVLGGWAVAMQGGGEEGIAQIRQGVAAYRATGAALLCPYFLALLAEAYQRIGRGEAGLRVLEEAWPLVDQGVHFYAAELHRLTGECLLHQAVPDALQAAHAFQQALHVARHQQAKSLELRAATNLARLWQSQGTRQEAYDLLAPVYSWFTEGFETADLQEARALLEELA